MTLKHRPIFFRLPGQKPAVYRHYHRLAWLACALALCVIVFGAFVRLSNAGLSCPDWPTCYGQATWPSAGDEVDHAATAIRAFDDTRAWREQVHRMLAGTLGVLVLLLAVLAAKRERHGVLQVLAAALLVGGSIPLYMRGQHGAAALLAGAGELILLAAALRWSRHDGSTMAHSLPPIAALTLAVIVFQALLGMWTVTWLLKPVVVMGHLLGGLATFALLAWLAWRATGRAVRVPDARLLRRLLVVGLVLLVAQIALGGWTSANYAALSCGTQFPRCLGTWWPHADWREAIHAAVHPNGQLIVDVVPALELIIGPQPRVPELEALEAQNRFNLAFQNFVQVFCKKTHPLVLFLDDMQWADSASLNLITRIVSARATESLLLVLTYRDTEVPANHPFMLAVKEQVKQGVPVQSIALKPLGIPEVAEFVADALHQTPLAVTPLAELIQQKTGGNPFFMRQFLQALYSAKLITFHAQTKQFQYDVEAVKNAAITENVAELLATDYSTWSR